MNIKEQHYDIKWKLNKIDSRQYRNLKVPEIDWAINEAINVYVKSLAEPRYKNLLGFEINQRSIDSIRTLVVDNHSITTTELTLNSYLAKLPENYWFFISGHAIASKDVCSNKKLRLIQKQHDDRHEDFSFYKSSFEWREANIEFFEEGIRVFTDGTFSVNEVRIDYIRRPAVVHNAEDFRDGSYRDLKGNLLTGTQDCDLPEVVHREINDLAVLIISNNIDAPNFQLKSNKIKLTD